jgi:hypothetical protein
MDNGVREYMRCVARDLEQAQQDLDDFPEVGGSDEWQELLNLERRRDELQEELDRLQAEDE